MISRRTFLHSVAGVAGAGCTIGGYAWQIEPHWLEVVRRPLPIAHLPAVLVGQTLVQLSDIHVGPRVSDAYVERALATARALEPAIVAYTGDMTSYHPDVVAHAERLYRDLPKGRLGTILSFGNHEYGPGWSRRHLADRFADLFSSLGAEVLRNRVVEIDGLQIAGLDDLWAGRFDAVATLERLERGRAALVLSHNPDTVDLEGWDGYDGWILAGHTHGGQCKPPFLPPPVLPVRNRRYTSGEFVLDGGRRMYISRGVGHLYQVRFNVRPEITLFELQSA